MRPLFPVLPLLIQGWRYCRRRGITSQSALTHQLFCVTLFAYVIFNERCTHTLYSLVVSMSTYKVYFDK